MSRLRKTLLGLLALLAVAAVLFGARVLMELHDGRDAGRPAAPRAAANAQLVAQGEYLARAGNCMACHTARGGAPGAGGASIPTPFGTVYTSNITPDVATGIGAWSADDFWLAMHEGRSRDGRLLYPAFPYPNTTHVARADADALFAYLQSLPPVAYTPPPHALRFPVNTQLALAAWRTLYFRPGELRPDPQQSAEWNRGAYLVQGLGHCNACHATRNVLGATRNTLDLGGGLIPMQNWYAPALNSPHEAGVAEWPQADVVSLLKNGIAPQGSVIGPMAEVVLQSTQHLNDTDLHAMATYLRALPQQGSAPKPRREAADFGGDRLVRGQALYGTHCASCHGEGGQGAPGIYPRLAGNRTVTMEPPANLVRVVLAGGFPPATGGNPRPYGMPPFATVLTDDEVAVLLSYVRNAWGHQASPLTTYEVNRYRTGSTAGSY
ncbi:MAG: c-type cytochrome [Aquincola tertiaricarbonis]